MIKKWSLKNFKSVKGARSLEFAPLTIFAGANSSGKSTIIQSILLTAQTIQNSVTNKSITLNGHISKFGSFDDILSNGAEEPVISIGFEIEPLSDSEGNYFGYSRYFMRHQDEIESVHCDFSFSDQTKGSKSELYKLQPKLMRSSLKFKTRDSVEQKAITIERSSYSIEERIKKYELNENQIPKNEMQALEFEVKSPQKASDMPNDFFFKNYDGDGILVGAYLSHFLPRVLAIRYDNNEEENKTFWNILQSAQEQNTESLHIFDKLLNVNIKNKILDLLGEIKSEFEAGVRKSSEANINIENSLNKTMELLKDKFSFDNYKRLFVLRDIARALRQKLDESKNPIISLVPQKKPDFRLETLYGYFGYVDIIDYFFKKNLKYLGPLRDEPKPIYPLIGSSAPNDIGFKGENTAAVLEINRNTIIKYVSPLLLTKDFGADNDVVKDDSLVIAVLEWLEYMGIAEKVDTADKGKLGHELKILTPGANSLHDLTHVGVGVSQVLPILVLALLAEADSTLIFEQPELHLNPKVQTRLADFFFSMTILKKQCIVETHSEYLINRLRYQVAKGQDDSISKNILMYFVEKEAESSTYKKVTINKYGVIEDWPKGFFDENEETSASILRAGMEKRKKEKK